MTVQDLNLSYEQYRSVVLEALRTGRVMQLENLYEGAVVAARGLKYLTIDDESLMGYRPHPRLSQREYGICQDVIWDLIIEGVVRPGDKGGGNPSLPFIHLTEWGRSVVESEPPLPYDPDGYIRRLREGISDLDEVIVTYMIESLHAFRINCLLSSAITLGCASEKALLLLINAYVEYLPATKRQRFVDQTRTQMIKRQFDAMRKAIEGHLQPLLPPEIQEGLAIELNGLFELIRNQRNDAGHPTGKAVEREVAYANLRVFPVYLKKVYSLIEWLRSNPTVSLNSTDS